MSSTLKKMKHGPQLSFFFFFLLCLWQFVTCQLTRMTFDMEAEVVQTLKRAITVWTCVQLGGCLIPFLEIGTKKERFEKVAVQMSENIAS